MYQIISCMELKARLDAGDEFHLCMVAPQWQWDARHIPGSICVAEPPTAMQELKPDDHIVVYCSSLDCSASRQAARMLDEAGFQNVWHFEGGLQAWEEAGFPLQDGKCSDA
jgi:rhodanese-related sulfurtransferase